MNSGGYYQPLVVKVLGSGEPQYRAPEVPAWKGDILVLAQIATRLFGHKSDMSCAGKAGRGQ